MLVIIIRPIKNLSYYQIIIMVIFNIIIPKKILINNKYLGLDMSDITELTQMSSEEFILVMELKC
jgi:hypothetical protein